jgi:hypothetical protein
MQLIRVTNLENSVAWEKQLTEREFDQIEKFIEGESTVPFTAALLVPVRTNNFMNFAKDFFLPATVNHALCENYSYFKSDRVLAKIANVVLRALSVLSSLCIDLMTLPIRIFTCIPRAYFNQSREKSAFHRYLIEQKVDAKLLESGSVEVLVGRGNGGDSPVYWVDIANIDLIETPSKSSPDLNPSMRLQSLRQWEFNKKLSVGVYVKNPNNGAVWSKIPAADDYNRVKESLTKGQPTVNLVKASLYPVRTNTLKNFATDLFLPMTLNVAIRVERAAYRAFAIIGAILFDLLTLPIRLVTAIPRLIGNRNPKITPLHQFLLDNKVNGEVLETDHVHVQLERYEYKGDKDHRERIHTWEEKYVNFIEMPMHEGWDVLNSKTKKSQIGNKLVL